METQEQKIANLLKLYEEGREELRRMVEEIDQIAKNIFELFPKDTTDIRNKFVLEEKLKAASAILGVKLNVLQEIHRTIKDEVDLRRKTVSSEGDVEDLVDRAVRDFVTKAEALAKKKEKIEESKSKNILSDSLGLG